MFVHVWRMRGRKKKVEQYEKFGRQVTLPALKKIEGCLDAYFFRVYESRKPEYLWVVHWKDNEALEAARRNPLWREQIKKFEEGEFYKTIPLELVCECLGSFASPGGEKSKKADKGDKGEKAEKAEKSESAPKGFVDSTPEGE